MSRRPRVAAELLLLGLTSAALLGVGACTSVVPASSSGASGQTFASSPASTIAPPPSTTTTVEREELYTADWSYERANLAYLVSTCEIIIRGQVVEEPAARWNSPDGKPWQSTNSNEAAQFYTTWTIEAQEVLKGGAHVGQRLLFHAQGGTVEMNGRVAHYVGNDFPEMTKGDEVIIFGRTESPVWGTENLPGLWIPAGFFAFAKGKDGTFQRLVEGYGPVGSDTVTPDEVRSMIDDTRAGQIRDYFGLWAENVETLPARPSELPPHFLTPPGKIEAFRGGDGKGNPFVLPASGVKKPLWVFADGAHVSEVGAKIRAAMEEERPLVIAGADEEEVYPYLPGSEEVVFFTPDVPRERKLISWVPYQGFRTSIRMGSVAPVAGTQELTEAENVYWQMAALTLWRDWRTAWRRKPDSPTVGLWPQNRGPYPSSFPSESGPSGLMPRWVWQNGGNIVPDSSGKPFAIPVPQQIPAGILVPAQVVPGSPTGMSRSGIRPDPPASWLAPGEWEQYVRLYRTGLTFYLIQGYDGYMHPAAKDDKRMANSPAPLAVH